MDGASAAPTLAAVYSANPSSRMGRRPHRSDSGPHTICEHPKASSKPVKVSWACDSGAPKPEVMAGSAGRYKSVVMG